MPKTTKERNQMECNKQARKRYKEKNFKYQTVCFKIGELEAIELFCKETGIPKNTLIRQAVMAAISSPIEK